MRRKYPFSIAEIAALAEVSCATVSRVLNNQDAVKPELYDKVCDAPAPEVSIRMMLFLQVENAGKLILFTLPFDFNSFLTKSSREPKRQPPNTAIKCSFSKSISTSTHFLRLRSCSKT